MKKWALYLILLLGMLAGFGQNASATNFQLEATPGLYVGSQAPDFTAQTHEGETVTLSELTAKGPVVLIFYRGAWCAYCNLHLREFQQQINAFKEQGATLLAVSVDLKKYALKAVEKNALGFQVISDPNAKILGDYNLFFKVPEDLAKTYKTEYNIDLEAHSGNKDHIIAVPATYVINKKGKIIFAYANKDYKIRTSPEEVLQVLKTLK